MSGSIAILGTRGIPALYGGFETFAQELSVRLAGRGVSVTVYCETRPGEMPEQYEGVRLVHLDAPRLGPLTTLLFDLRCLWHARKRFDVVYMLGYGAGIFCIIPRLWGRTVWINMDGVEWARPKWGRIARTWFKIMEAVSVRVPDRVIADAGEIARLLRSRHERMRPCSVIPYGAHEVDQAPDEALLAEWGLQPEQYDLIVCRLEPENTVAEIIEGYGRSTSPVPLVVVGDHRNGSAYVRGLLEQGDGRVRFIGTVYVHEKLKALRYHARAYFHGHRVGGTNPSLLEAMGCGNIIIAHDNVFNREVAGEAAFYFKDAEDVPAMLDAIEGLNGEEKLTRRRQVKERIRSRYNWDLVADQYHALLQDLAADDVPGQGGRRR